MKTRRDFSGLCLLVDKTCLAEIAFGDFMQIDPFSLKTALRVYHRFRTFCEHLHLRRQRVFATCPDMTLFNYKLEV